MRILLKCPTRSRPSKVMETLRRYIQLANHPEQLGVAISCDTDDSSMTRNLVQEELLRVLKPCEWKRIFFSENHSKIQACNANMSEIDYPWDIVVLVSDDMLPVIKGYDDVIRNYMTARFPDTNGILWFNDGFQGEKLNTLCIYGRRMYESFGYLYHPSYKSLFCDTELTDLCKTTLKDKTHYVGYTIIRHEHPGTGYGEKMDALYQANQRYWSTDMLNYIARKQYMYDWSILVPTIASREQQLAALLASIREKAARLRPTLRIEFCIEYDNRETSVGNKRQRLLERASGKYMSFIDDDDQITDAYIEDVWETIQGGYHVMRLRGEAGRLTFTHSVENKLSTPMAIGDVFVRPPNHLNPMLTDVAKLISFKDASRGEDLDWTIRLARTGFLKTEYASDPSRIHYIYMLFGRDVESSLEYQRTHSYDEMLRSVWTPGGGLAVLPEPTPRSEGRVLRLGPKGFVSK
jgi:hypothetical protein